MTDISVPVIADLAEQFSQETLSLCEDAGLSAFEHAVALAVAAEHAQIALKRMGMRRGGTEADWQAYCGIRDGFVDLTREAAAAADEDVREARRKERAGLG